MSSSHRIWRAPYEEREVGKGSVMFSLCLLGMIIVDLRMLLLLLLLLAVEMSFRSAESPRRMMEVIRFPVQVT